MTNLLTVFNDHFVDFISDVQNVFPEDVDILAAKNSLLAVRKANPKLLAKIWYTQIALKYRQQIEAGDIEFFLNKDYKSDISADNSNKI